MDDKLTGLMDDKETHGGNTLKRPPHSQRPRGNDLSAYTCL